jgi:hypothetical protein
MITFCSFFCQEPNGFSGNFCLMIMFYSMESNSMPPSPNPYQFITWLLSKWWWVDVQVLILAAVRIRNLCERLGQPQPLVERVYRVFQHTLHRETSLFFNRHIDQLILCTIYGVCKVSPSPLFTCILFGHLIFDLWQQLAFVWRSIPRVGPRESLNSIEFLLDVLLSILSREVYTRSCWVSPWC